MSYSKKYGEFMVELPEALLISKQMNNVLVGKKVIKVDIGNFKPSIFFLNVSVEEFKERVVNCLIKSVYCKGKWIFTEFDSNQIFATAPEMGVDILYHSSGTKFPETYHFLFKFDDGSSLTLKYHGFIFARLGSLEELEKERYPGKIGPTPLDKEFTYDKFSNLLSNSKKMVKALLLDHQNLPGVANFYLNEAFFRAKIHPKKKACDLNNNEKESLYRLISKTLQDALNQNGRHERKDIFGEPGLFKRSIDSKSVGKPCPNCETEIIKINVSGTNSYLCPNCQKI